MQWRDELQHYSHLSGKKNPLHQKQEKHGHRNSSVHTISLSPTRQVVASEVKQSRGVVSARPTLWGRENKG